MWAVTTVPNAPDWRRRFTAPRLGFPRWAPGAPDAASPSPTKAASPRRGRGTRRREHAARRATSGSGSRRRSPAPTASASSGGSIERATNAAGGWRRRSRAGRPVPLVEDLHDAWGSGVSMADGVVAVGLSDEEHYSVWIARDGSPSRLLAAADGVPRRRPRVGAERRRTVGRRQARVSHRRQAGRHPASRASGRPPGHGGGRSAGCSTRAPTSRPLEWSPVAGRRSGCSSSRSTPGIERPAVWDLATGRARTPPLDLPGPVEWACWWPDASALVLLHRPDGRAQLHPIRPRDGRSARAERTRWAMSRDSACARR